VAIFDIDTPDRNQGLKMLSQCKQLSPRTNTIILTTRECGINHVIKANDLGCYNFIDYKNMVGNYLLERIKLLAQKVSYQEERDVLLQQMGRIHKKFFKEMLHLHIKTMDAEEHLRAISGIPDEELPPISILIVDNQKNLYNILTSKLTKKQGWNFDHVTLASSALEYASDGKYHMFLINISLPDLPGSIVANTIQDETPDVRALIYEYDPEIESRLSIFEASGGKRSFISIDSSNRAFRPRDAKPVRQVENPVQVESENDLIGKIRQVRQELALKERKKHYKKTFKVQHYDFIREFKNLSERLQRAFELDPDKQLH
jgi:DNA-binding NarL/FixJ family response regulator